MVSAAQSTQWHHPNPAAMLGGRGESAKMDPSPRTPQPACR